MTPPKKKRRDPLLDAADALDRGVLTHEALRNLWNPETLAEAHQQDVDLGPIAAGALGAARGASFGLSDLAQKLALTQGEKAAIQATATEHPHATTAGTLAGAALPFLLTGGESSAALPRLSVRGTQTALGALQGAGLTEGGIPNRAAGAALGAAGARYAPQIMKGAAAVGGRLPLIGGLLRNLPGMAAKAPVIAEVAPRALLMHTAGDAVSDIAQAQADFAAKRISQADLDAAMDFARQQMGGRGLLSSGPPALTPMPDAPQGLLGPEGISPPPKASYPPTISEMQGYNTAPGKPGHPVWQGEGSPTRSVATEPLTPSPASTDPMRTLLRKQSTTKLRATLAKPETPTPVRQLIQIELKRRRI